MDTNILSVYYQSGIGTGLGIYSHLVGGGTGVGLEEHIREAYAFLANNYREEIDPDHPLAEKDSIFLIGFSRGAFTARSIGGLLGAVGLLKKRAMAHFFEIFSDWENAGREDYKPLFFDSYFSHHHDVDFTKPPDKLAKDKTRIPDYMNAYFDRLHALGLTNRVDVKCIGVWDTVGALGIPVNPLLQRAMPFLPSFVREYSWFDTGLDEHVKNAFQALALDERRYPFSPTLWERPKDCKKTNLRQVWFPGVHSNVGGSYADAGIADVTLAWMMDQLAGNTIDDPDSFRPLNWIKFDDDYLTDLQNCDVVKDIVEEREEKQEEEKNGSKYRLWAMGYIYNTVYFPTSLTGTIVRGPGRYRKTNYETGKPEKRYLEDTQERIHSSVRARIDLGGRGVEPDWNQIFPNSMNFLPWFSYLWRKMMSKVNRPYQPHLKGGPLAGWRLDDGHKSHHQPNMDIDMSPDGQERIAWIYEGETPVPVKVMPEEKLGPYERLLLRKYNDSKKLAQDILVSNKSWKRTNTRPHMSPKHSHTWAK